MHIHKLKGYIQDIYLIESDEGLLLLDGCSRVDTHMICAFIKNELKRPLTELKLIVVSHMHPDHAGGAHKLRRLTGAAIASANTPGQWYQGARGLITYCVDLFLTLWVANRKRSGIKNIFYPRFLKADYFLPHDSHLPIFSDWRVFHTPGHTDRDISLYHHRRKCLYVADLMVLVKGRCIAPYPIHYPDKYIHSLNLVKTLAPKTLLLAHHGEVPLTEQLINDLLVNAPKNPTTYTNSLKRKIKRRLSNL